jgi:hypothetical protein
MTPILKRFVLNATNSGQHGLSPREVVSTQPCMRWKETRRVRAERTPKE